MSDGALSCVRNQTLQHRRIWPDVEYPLHFHDRKIHKDPCSCKSFQKANGER